MDREWKSDSNPACEYHLEKIIKEFEPPPMDVAMFDEIQAFVEKRTSEGGAPVDS